MGADATDIGKTIHPHPTLGESIGMAAEAVRRRLHRPAAAAQEVSFAAPGDTNKNGAPFGGAPLFFARVCWVCVRVNAVEPQQTRASRKEKRRLNKRGFSSNCLLSGIPAEAGAGSRPRLSQPTFDQAKA